MRPAGKSDTCEHMTVLSDDNRIRLLVISGPTASGKSSLGIRLAHILDGEIISADSMQVYRDMDIGTAKVRPEETESIPHHMIDITDPRDSFNIAQYTAGAKACIEDIASRGKLPIVVGGTGFYIHALIYDTVFSEEDDEDRRVRAELEALSEAKGDAYMWELLRQEDPISAENIHPHNKKRVIRALEYLRLTGQRLSEHNIEQKARSSPYDFLYLAINKDREKLYADIDRRVDIMMEQGLETEVRGLYDAGCRAGMVSMQAIGYKELMAYIEGKCTRQEAIETIKLESRRYAKRQMTWLRHEKDIYWLDGADTEAAETVIRERWKT